MHDVINQLKQSLTQFFNEVEKAMRKQLRNKSYFSQQTKP